MRRQGTQATNLTVLGAASLSRTLPVVGLALVLLFVLMKPEATSGYPVLGRLAFWTVHIGLGLGSILVTSKLIRPGFFRDTPHWLAILVTGLAGAAILAPLYLLLEGLVPTHLVDEPDDWLDVFAAQGLLQSVLAEFIEVTPVFLATWFAVNLPLLFAGPEVGEEPPGKPDGPGGSRSDRPATGGKGGREDTGDSFFSRLPRVIGRDIIVVSSDMHYLHVYTTQGKCMILGTIRDAAEELGDIGMLVHRSHWVAHDHVRRLVRRGRSWECVMTNDHRVPVSRRNQQKVTEWYGKSGNVVSLAAGKARMSGRPG